MRTPVREQVFLNTSLVDNIGPLSLSGVPFYSRNTLHFIVKGLIRKIIGDRKRNQEASFKYGLKLLFWIFVIAIAILISLSWFGYVPAVEVLIAEIYTAILFTFEYSTIRQVSGILRLTGPELFDLIGLSIIFRIVLWIGAIGIGVKWALVKRA